MIKSGITREEIVRWGGADVFNQALAIVNSGDVKSVRYDDDTVTISGKIERPDGWEMPVSFVLKEQGRIESHCPCYQNQKLGQVCPHVVALAIAQMVLEADDEPEERTGNKAERRGGGGGGGGDGGSAPGQHQDAAPDADLIAVPMKPKFYALVSGSRASLSIAVDAWYDDIDFPACSLQAESLVSLPDPNDPLVRRTRSMDAEREALKLLESSWGFEQGYRKGLSLIHI